jgi:phosphoenolpyruvate-protein phosphotransferase
VWLSARGTEASQALSALKSFFRAGLGEGPSNAAAPAARATRFVSDDDKVIGGVPASPGLAVGRVAVASHDLPNFDRRSSNPSAAKQQLRDSIDAARKDLVQAQSEFQHKGQTEMAEIFAAHAELIGDAALCTDADCEIDQGASAAAAWQAAIAARVDKLEALNNPLMRLRTVDLKDVGVRVLRKILGIPDKPPRYSKETVLVAHDLAPSEVARLDAATVGALVTSLGGPTSHAAIIARSIGVPYVTGVGEAATSLRAGVRVIVDGDEGWVNVDPDDRSLQSALRRIEQRRVRDQDELDAAHAHAVTVDGREIEVAANIGSASDAERAVQQGCDAVGLLRSEFLFLERRQAPTEGEQRDQYVRIARALGKERSLVVRTLDVGGDKPLSYMPLAAEENPFLGVRGIRLSFEYPDQFSMQLRAILGAAAHTKLRVMFPMVARLDEFLRARDALLEQADALPGTTLEIGVMVEVPSAALMADELAREADFFSIGTNDLTQYTLAMDRGHPKLAAQADAMDPAVLRLIRITADAAHDHGRWVGVCGGLAAEAVALPLLIGLGIDELSVPAPAIPRVKAQIRQLNHLQCQALAKEALRLPSAEQIRRLYENFNS